MFDFGLIDENGNWNDHTIGNKIEYKIEDTIENEMAKNVGLTVYTAFYLNIFFKSTYFPVIHPSIKYANFFIKQVLRLTFIVRLTQNEGKHV